MKLRPRGLVLLAPAMIAALAVLGCRGRHLEEAPGSGAAAALTQLSCGDKTYRLEAGRITSDISGACNRYQTSQDALQAYRATMTRFTCQRSDGHVTQSVLVPGEQLDQYSSNCREYQSGAALPKFVAQSNTLARQHLDHDNALFHQSKTDLGALDDLVRAAGGSREIPK
jgi:hypothetical protein